MVRPMRDRSLTRKTAQAGLLESPVAALRRRQGLSRDQAAEHLGISLLRLARLEAATRRLPARTLRSIAAALTPADRFSQISMWDADIRASLRQTEHGDLGAGSQHG
jgi:transcriptional regulator with XRE-family HTH domain